MALQSKQPKDSGQQCSTPGTYRIRKEDLEYIKSILDKVDGEYPYVVFDINDVRKDLANGTKSSPGCISYFVNKYIEEVPELKQYGIYLHSRKGDIMFNRIKGRGTLEESESE